MRIVIDMQGAQTGSRLRGIGRYTVSIAKALARNQGEHEVLLALNGVFTETIDGLKETFRGLLLPEQIRVWHAIGPTRYVDPENHWRRSVSERIRETFLESLQPDIVLVSSHFEGFEDEALGGIRLLGDSIPVAVILHDLIPLLRPSDARPNDFRRAWYQERIETLKRSAMLLAISESVRGESLMALEWDPDRIVAIGGAPDDSFRAPRPASPERHASMARCGIARPFVMYAGGADASKNLPRLIAAYAELPFPLRQTHQLVLVGAMPDESVRQLRQYALRAGLQEADMVITGHVPDADLIALYGSCSLFVFPALREGFGLAPLEAMASGAVVIGADATGLREVIALPEARFDPESTSAMAAKIILGLTDEDYRSRLRAHANAHLGRFSWDHSARRALAALQSCCDQHRARISPLLNLSSSGVYRRRELRILVIKLDHMGDFLLSIPALTKLRARYPYASIDLVVGSWNVLAAKGMGLFREIYSYDFFKQKSSDSPSTKAGILDSLLRQLPHYDIAIDLRRFPESRFLLHRIDTDLRVGYQTYDPQADKGLDIALPIYFERSFVATPLNHVSQIQQMVALVDALPADINDFVSFPPLGPVGKRQAGTVAVFPKAGKPVRDWSVEHFKELVTLLLQNSHVLALNVYFVNEREAAEFGFAAGDKLQLCVGLSFPDLIQSLSTNSLCIANNSGGAHLASYLQVPVIAIFSGHELPSEWGPQYNDSYVLHRGAQCAPCHLGKRQECPNGLYCLQDIAVFDVYAKAVEVLAKAASGAEVTHGVAGAVVSQQLNEDGLVRRLLDSIAALGPIDDEAVLRSLAESIGRNHPTYTVNPDLTGINPNEVVDHHSRRIEWRGFSGSEAQWRWSESTSATIVFEYLTKDDKTGRANLKLIFNTLGRQRIIARLNGRQVVSATYDGKNIRLMVPGKYLKVGSNALEFELPDARMPGNGDTRRLAIAVKSLEIQMRDAPGSGRRRDGSAAHE
jgi:ADP-heptose:LPS heptosyltransferase/glycosyltransferase involved in cell wall biosynthesis